jgi:hypothetical protein
MCRRVECSKCGRPSYAGCGAHVEQVLAGVPTAERCHCRENDAKKAGAQPEARTGPSSWLRELLGK